MIAGLRRILHGFCSQFILSREALCLYRQFLRVSRDAGGAREREEMRRWVRGEFDKWRHTTDEVISFLLWFISRDWGSIFTLGACAARVTASCCVCLSVSQSVSLFHISLHE